MEEERREPEDDQREEDRDVRTDLPSTGRSTTIATSTNASTRYVSGRAGRAPATGAVDVVVSIGRSVWARWVIGRHTHCVILRASRRHAGLPSHERRGGSVGGPELVPGFGDRGLAGVGIMLQRAVDRVRRSR